MNDKDNYAFETDFGLFGGLALGVNYNYAMLHGQAIHGIKPFIGFALYHFQFYYGYAFYNNALDVGKQLKHNRFTVSVNVPIAKLGKQGLFC